MTDLVTSRNTVPPSNTARPSDSALPNDSALPSDGALPSDSADPAFFDRCVDWLLSLYGATTDPVLRDLVTDVLDELREIGPVSGEFADVVLGALASVELAFELPAAAA